VLRPEASSDTVLVCETESNPNGNKVGYTQPTLRTGVDLGDRASCLAVQVTLNMHFSLHANGVLVTGTVRILSLPPPRG
jgi:hypothetical protein